MIELKNGSRVYLSDKNVFGKIVRDGVLGLKSKSFLIADESGKQYIYTGSSAMKNVINTITCTNEEGCLCTIPSESASKC